MKKFNFKLLSIVFIFMALLISSCSETDENILQQEVTKLNEQPTPSLIVPEIKLPEIPEALILELQRLKKIEKSKIYAAKSVATTIVVPRDYPTIQEAVDAASPGDKIRVRPGTYNENVNIVKNGITLSALNEVYLYGNIYIYQSENVSVSGFNVQNTNENGTGIYLYQSFNVEIIKNNIIVFGVESIGISINSSPSSTISGNTIKADYGIWVGDYHTEGDSSNSKILNNTVEASFGISLYYAYGRIKVTKNRITGVKQDLLSSKVNASNLAEESSYGFYGIWIYGSQEKVVSFNSCTNFGNGIRIFSFEGVTVKRNNTFKNGIGIFLYGSGGNNVISNQCLSNDTYGIYLYISHSNLIKNNIAYFNGLCGIVSDGYSTNRFISNYTDCEVINEEIP